MARARPHGCCPGLQKEGPAQERGEAEARLQAVLVAFIVLEKRVEPSVTGAEGHSVGTVTDKHRKVRLPSSLTAAVRNAFIQNGFYYFFWQSLGSGW